MFPTDEKLSVVSSASPPEAVSLVETVEDTLSAPCYMEASKTNENNNGMEKTEPSQSQWKEASRNSFFSCHDSDDSLRNVCRSNVDNSGAETQRGTNPALESIGNTSNSTISEPNGYENQCNGAAALQQKDASDQGIPSKEATSHAPETGGGISITDVPMETMTVPQPRLEEPLNAVNSGHSNDQKHRPPKEYRKVEWDLLTVSEQTSHSGDGSGTARSEHQPPAWSENLSSWNPLHWGRRMIKEAGKLRQSKSLFTEPRKRSDDNTLFSAEDVSREDRHSAHDEIEDTDFPDVLSSDDLAGSASSQHSEATGESIPSHTGLYREALYTSANPIRDVVALRALLPFGSSLTLSQEEYQGGCPRCVFFTGATGFMGRMVLAALVSFSRETQVYCLVRANSREAAFDRVVNALQEGNFWDDSLRGKIKALKGDFEKPLLGLSMSEFRRMSEMCDAVYHCGGIGSYKRIQALYVDGPRSANLVALNHVIRLCITGRLKALHTLSALDVFMPVLAMCRNTSTLSVGKGKSDPHTAHSAPEEASVVIDEDEAATTGVHNSDAEESESQLPQPPVLSEDSRGSLDSDLSLEVDEDTAEERGKPQGQDSPGDHQGASSSVSSSAPSEPVYVPDEEPPPTQPILIPERGWKVSIRQMQNRFPVATSTVAGHAWSKIAAEEVLFFARQCALPVYVYRLPPMFLSTGPTCDLRSLFAATLIAACEVGCFPVDASGICPLPLIAADAAAARVVQLSLLPKQRRKYTVYHVVPSGVDLRTGILGVPQEDFTEWGREYGFFEHWRPVDIDEFISNVTSSPAASSLTRNVEALRTFPCFDKSLDSAALSPLQRWIVGNRHLQEDMKTVQQISQGTGGTSAADIVQQSLKRHLTTAWPSQRRTLHRGLTVLLNRYTQRCLSSARVPHFLQTLENKNVIDKVLMESFQRLNFTKEECMNSSMIQFAATGWKAFYSSLFSDGCPMLEDVLLVHRLMLSHLMSVLHCVRRENNPIDLQAGSPNGTQRRSSRPARPTTGGQDDVHPEADQSTDAPREEMTVQELVDSKVEQPVVLLGFNDQTVALLHQLLSLDDSSCIAPTIADFLSPYGIDGMVAYTSHPLEDDPRWQSAEYLNLRSGFQYCPQNQEKSYPVACSAVFEMFGRSLELAERFFVPTYEAWLSANNYEMLRAVFPYFKRVLYHLTVLRRDTLTLRQRWVLRLQSVHMGILRGIDDHFQNPTYVTLHTHPATEIPRHSRNGLKVRRYSGILPEPSHDEEKMRVISEVIERLDRLLEQYLDVRQTDGRESAQVLQFDLGRSKHIFTKDPSHDKETSMDVDGGADQSLPAAADTGPEKTASTPSRISLTRGPLRPQRGRSIKRQAGSPFIDISTRLFLLNPIEVVKSLYRSLPCWRSIPAEAYETMWSYLFDELPQWKTLSNVFGDTDTRLMREKALQNLGLEPEEIRLVSFERYVNRYLSDEDRVDSFSAFSDVSKRSFLSKLRLSLEAAGRAFHSRKTKG